MIKSSVLNAAAALLILRAAVPGWGMAKKPDSALAAESRAGKITLQEVEFSAGRYVKQLQRLSPGKTFSAAEMKSLNASVLGDMILHRIFLTLAKKEGLTVSDGEVRERYQIVASGIFESDEGRFKQALAEDGWTEEAYNENLREIILAEKARAVVLGGVAVESTQARDYYGRHPDEFRAEETEVSHILLSAPDVDMPERGLKTVRTLLREQGVAEDSLDARAARETDTIRHRLERVRDSALQGGDFASLARRHSQDPTASEGGSLGKIRRGTMVPTFDSAAFALQKGGISGVVRTEFGFHLLKAFSDPSARIQDFPEVESAIIEKLRGAEEVRRLKKLEKKWKVRRYGEYGQFNEESQ